MRYGFVIGAIQSGAGKTTVSLGLMALLRNRYGLTVQAFKVGPDFIDPGLHHEVTGRVSWNLDRWMCPDEYLCSLFQEKTKDADVAVVEGVMGLFDGDRSSTAQTAKLLGLPVVVVLDVRSMAQSAAAIIKGIEELDKELAVAGVIINNAGSPRHGEMVTEALHTHCKARVMGIIARNGDISLPQRHLGLFTREDEVIDAGFVQKLCTTLESGLKMDAFLESVRLKQEGNALATPPVSLTRPTVRLAVARDKAFCFYYEDNLELLRQAGAQTVFFSPLTDGALPDGTDGLYLGGGYPELYARALSANTSMRDSIGRFVRCGGVTYGECGGFMYLTQGITDRDGLFFPLVGIYPVTSIMSGKRVQLGYREAVLARESPLGSAGARVSGHEFHYSSIEPMPDSVARAFKEGPAMAYLIRGCLAGYVHLHFASNPDIAASMVKAMAKREGSYREHE